MFLANSSKLVNVKLEKPALSPTRPTLPNTNNPANTSPRYTIHEFLYVSQCSRTQGNCKFGQKCALLHVLPNGRVINNPNRNAGNLNIGGRVEPPPYQNQESALGNSLLAQQVGGMPQPFNHQIPHLPDYDPGLPVPPRSQPFDIPQPVSKFGTPKEELHQAMSPIPHLTTLDAPLPASFDSNGISYMAIHGPVAASMPPRVGHESPLSSLPKKIGHAADGPRNMPDSGFGNPIRGFNLGSSPLGPSNDAVGQRIMHSQRVTRQNRLSASLPRTMEHEWEHDQDEMLFGNEEEWIPAGLSHLMTPEERNRRTSGKVENPTAIRESLSGNNSNEMTTKIGSPSNASPSRYSVWNKPKTDDDSSGFPSPSFGPVGSPLRNATLHPGASPSLRAVRGAGDLAFKVSSPPRYSSTSMLSQQLQRTRLSSRASESSETSSGGLHPIRHTSNPRSVFDRAVSSNSVTAERIDEEQPEMVFSLEEEEYGSSNHSKSNANIWGPAGITRTASGRKNNHNDKETNRNPSK